MLIKFREDSFLKVNTKDSSKLGDKDKVKVRKGMTIEISAYLQEGNHTKFTIKYRNDDIEGLNTWYAFNNHISIEHDGKNIFPSLPLLNELKGGKKILLPKFGTVYCNEPIIKDGNFTWGEATHNGERTTNDSSIVDGMYRIAELAQKARDQINEPFRITSWYRPPAINRRIGGASNSRHLYGDAIDFYVKGMSAKQLSQALEWWPGGMGTYSNMPHILHLDARGYKARWGPY